MPRPKKPGGPEPKRRSRNGCWPCKTRKIKCGEEKPKCQNCERQSEMCDYSIRLNWEGRPKRKSNDFSQEVAAFKATPTPKSGRFPTTISRTSSDNSTHRLVEAASVKHENAKFFQSPIHQSPVHSPIGNHTKIRDRLGEASAQEHGLPVDSRETTIDHTRNTPFQALSAGGNNSGDSMLSTDVTALISHAEVLSRASASDASNTSFAGPQRLGFRDPLSASQLSRIRDQTNGSYPSPTDSNTDSPLLVNSVLYHHAGHFQPTSNPQMRPPIQSPVSYSLFSSAPRKSQEELPIVGEHRTKRLRMSPTLEIPESIQRTQPNVYSSYNGGHSKGSSSYHSPPFPSHRPYSPSNKYGGFALTPASSSATLLDDAPTPRPVTKSSVQVLMDSPDLRRLSVSSLLSPTGGEETHQDTEPGSIPPISPSVDSQGVAHRIYGLDRGFPDYDWPNNNDAAALNGITPSLPSVSLYYPDDASQNLQIPPAFGFGLHSMNESHSQEGYYARGPVTVSIPTSLGALPDELLDNPMNMLYFHHFLNHTASILVPHDCSENPFKNILPQMAVKDSNLLRLLLAYSASHRARLLKHQEPAYRIAHWVENVFPSLRRALETNQITNEGLATAIMLASLEIISPNTFEAPVTWQNYLHIARRMIFTREYAGSISRKDRVSYFLSRWFAYLDVLGSLSGSKNDQPLFSGDYWAPDEADNDDHVFQIDCLMGFTSRCVSILAKIAELARLCDSERIDLSGNLRDNWTPSAPNIEKAMKLKQDLHAARTHRYAGCPHRKASNEAEDEYDSREMTATNDAFHWAGLIHLNRRILGKDSEDPDVQLAVKEIINALSQVRKGGTAEACLLFPMFTAGCDAQEEKQRERIMERVRSVEKSGMTQVNNARRLMEKVWETGRPWETLVSGEFFG